MSGEKLLTEEEISKYTVPELYSERVKAEYLYTQDSMLRGKLAALLLLRAKEFKIDLPYRNVLKDLDKEIEKEAKEQAKQLALQEAEDRTEIALKFDGKGQPLNTIENFLMIINYDTHFAGLQFNALSYSPEQIRNNVIERWTDADDSSARAYCEMRYRIHNREKLDDALRIKFNTNSYHPIKNIINSVKWDGIERIETLLIKWLRCEDSIYAKEVSRLIFAGGIHRLYNPGCKFDDVPVLIGTKQGEGKSSFVRWLALKDEFFSEISEFEGQKGIEAIEGVWICEIAELLAVTKNKEQEAVKAYITKQVDKYRRPFDRRVTEHPRQCIFIGTTNKQQFLIDKTGNRRFYPLQVHSSGYDLFDNEDAIRSDILQCWAEAKHKINDPIMKACCNPKLAETIKEHQNDAVEEDYREELIHEYLEDKREVCLIEIWEKALKNEHSHMTKKDSSDIVLILQILGDWERGKSKYYTGKKRRYWTRKDTDAIIDEKLPF